MELTDEIILERGYKEYEPTRFHNRSVVKCFQKRFDDETGKKYFIDINKWYWGDTVPLDRQNDEYCYKEYTYQIKTQLYDKDEHNAINLEFLSSWDLEKAEEFIEKLFQFGMLDYYEKWCEC